MRYTTNCTGRSQAPQACAQNPGMRGQPYVLKHLSHSASQAPHSSPAPLLVRVCRTWPALSGGARTGARGKRGERGGGTAGVLARGKASSTCGQTAQAGDDAGL